MQNIDSGSSGYVTLTQEAVVVNTVKNEQNIEIKIYETDRELIEPMYAAELEYNGFRYLMSGIDSQGEIEKIAKFVLIF